MGPPLLHVENQKTSMTDSAGRQNKISRKSYLIDFLILLVLFSGLFAPYLFTSRVFPKWFSDVQIVTRPNLVFTARCLLNGSLPLWNPYAGYPTHALGCAGTFYPTTVLYGLLSFHNAFKVDLLLHLYVTAVTSYLLGRMLTNRRSAGLAVALLVLTSRFLLVPSFGGNIWQIRLLTWFPLAWLTLVKTIETGQMKWGLGLALLLALQVFAGDYQMFVYQLLWLGMVTVACLCVRRLQDHDGPARLAQRGALCLAAVVLGLGISAAQWLPGRELLGQSIRSHGVTLHYVSSYAGSVRYFLNEILLTENENALGMSFAGPFVAGLFVMGALQGRGKHRWMAVVTLLLGLAFTMWPRAPFAEFILRLPIIGQARFAMRMYNFCLFSSYLLAGFAISRLMGEREQRKAFLQWIIVVVICGTVSGLLILGDSSAWYLAFAAPLVLLGALAALMKRPMFGRAACVLLAAVFLGETFHFQRAAMSFGTPGEIQLHPDYLRFVAQRNDEDRLLVFHPKARVLHGLSVAGVLTEDRFVGINHTVILDNYARLLDELTPVEFIDVIDPGRRLNGEMYWNLYHEDWLSAEAAVYLDLFNVRYLLEVQRPLAYPEYDIAQGGQRFTKYTIGEMTVYENHRALPVAYAVHKARVADSLGETIELLRSGKVDVHQEAVVEAPFSPEVLQPLAQGSADAVSVLEYENTHVVVDATMASDGLVVLTDPHYPGWMAYVDGEPADVHLINGLVRGVMVPKGRHTVEFVFRSQSFRSGLVISVSSLILVGVLTARVWKRPRDVKPFLEDNA